MQFEQRLPSANKDRSASVPRAESIVPFPPRGKPAPSNTAVVYCEGNFGAIDGKTANGLVRHSQKYDILSVIDSQKAGQDSGVALGDAPNGIPVCRDLADALAQAPQDLLTFSFSGWHPPAACFRQRNAG
jgi:hypothetical protein